MASVYILYSLSLDSYYIGFTTEDVNLRVERHNTDYYQDKFTSNGKPWDLYHAIHCNTAIQARTIEKHIKSMKSKKYLQNLKSYPEMAGKLLTRFADS